MDSVTGKRIRGREDGDCDDYDRFVFDVHSEGVPPYPVDINSRESIHEKYDVLEEIGTGTFGVVHRSEFVLLKFSQTFNRTDDEIRLNSGAWRRTRDACTRPSLYPSPPRGRTGRSRGPSSARRSTS